MSSTRHLGALVLGAVLLTGCSQLDVDRARMERMPTPTTSAGEERTPKDPGSEAVPTEEPTTKAPKAWSPPGGYRTVTAEKSQLRFAAPKSWIITDAKRFEDLPDEVLEEMADAMNVSVDDVPLIMSQLDVILISPDGGSMNVAPAGLLAEIPSPVTLRAQLRLFHAEITYVEDVESPVGTARVVRYEVSRSGQTQHAIGIFVKLATGVTNLTISSHDRDIVESIYAKVLPSLDQSGAPGEA